MHHVDNVATTRFTLLYGYQEREFFESCQLKLRIRYRYSSFDTDYCTGRIMVPVDEGIHHDESLPSRNKQPRFDGSS